MNGKIEKGNPGAAPMCGTDALSFLGDAVYELMAREAVVNAGDTQSGDLHKKTVNYVSASAQSAAAGLLLPFLSEEEAAVYRRGRNSKSGSGGRGAGISEYRRATGLETLFGYLFLAGRTDRARELFELIVKSCSGDTAK